MVEVVEHLPCKLKHRTTKNKNKQAPVSAGALAQVQPGIKLIYKGQGLHL
jgi:hypothetical protein